MDREETGSKGDKEDEGGNLSGRNQLESSEVLGSGEGLDLPIKVEQGFGWF